MLKQTNGKNSRLTKTNIKVFTFSIRLSYDESILNHNRYVFVIFFSFQIHVTGLFVCDGWNILGLLCVWMVRIVVCRVLDANFHSDQMLTFPTWYLLFRFTFHAHWGHVLSCLCCHILKARNGKISRLLHYPEITFDWIKNLRT